jgi:Domain of unknown function (DUF4252)
MNAHRLSTRSHALAAAVALTAASWTSIAAADPPASPSVRGLPGYVDEGPFRALIDETKDVVEVNLEGPILQAIAKKKSEEDTGDADSVFTKLKSVHAVIGTIKGNPGEAMGLIQQLDKKLAGAGWQRITRIKDEDSWVSVLTHVTNDKIDGLVALIFDRGDNEMVFANLAGQIDITKLGEIGDRLHVPGLGQVPVGN